MTLVEILIATTIFAVFLTLIGTAAVRAYAYYAQSDRVQSSYRMGATQMQELRLQLKQCVQMMAPNPAGFNEGMTINPVPGKPFSYAYEKWDGNGAMPPALGYVVAGPVTIGTFEVKLRAWQFDKVNKVLQTFDCASDGVTPLGPVRTVCPNVQDFSVTRIPRSNNNNLLALQVLLTVQTDNKSFTFNMVGAPRSIGNGI